MRLTEELVIKFNTILDMLEVGYDHYFDRSDSGHCKLSDGYTSLSFQPYFWWYKGEEPEMEIYSYVLGTSRMHEFDSISEAYRNVREWVREEITVDARVGTPPFLFNLIFCGIKVKSLEWRFILTV